MPLYCPNTCTNNGGQGPCNCEVKDWLPSGGDNGPGNGDSSDARNNPFPDADNSIKGESVHGEPSFIDHTLTRT